MHISPRGTPTQRPVSGSARRTAIALSTALVAGATALLVSAPIAQAAAPIPLPVVARWNMNEGAGASTMNDSAPNNLDGTVGDLVTTGATFGGATGYRFTPTSPTNIPADPERVVNVPDTPLLDAGTDHYAIEFRYRTTRSWGNVVQKGQNTTFGGYWKFEQPNGRMTCLFKDADGRTLGVKAPEGKETNDNQWHTIRCERRTNFAVLFIDGVEAAKNSKPLGSISNSKQLSIGGKSSCDQVSVTCDYFNGDIDYVQIEKASAPTPPPNQPPAMTFSVECAVFDCDFDASESTDPDGTIESWAWAWGDGDGRTDDDPLAQHTFPGPGTYNVVLTGTDDDDATGTASQQLNPASPNQAPTMAISVSCTNLTCNFDSSGSTDPDGTIASRSWDFGDGETSSATAPTHTYDAPGVYTVALTGVDDDDASAASQRSVTVTTTASQPPLGGPSKLVSLPPARVFDTRPGPDPGPKGLVAGGGSIDVQVAGVAGVPASGVTAVAINVTAIGVEAPSFVSVRPAGTAATTTSNLNIVSQGQVRANLVIVPLGTGGKITLSTLGDAHLLGDIAGYFTPQTSPTAAGRVVTQAPQRLFDTRTGPDPGPKGRVAAGGTIDVAVLGTAGVPATGVSAVVLNVTATKPAAAGFVTVFAGTATRPTASAINVNGPGETVPNQVIVPVGTDGTISLYSLSATHLLADVMGYVTGTGGAASTSGLFVPLAPGRVFDTRPGEPGNGPKGQIAAGGTITPLFAGQAGVPAGAGAVVLNLTMIGTAPGYATLWPTGAAQPGTSNVNVGFAGDVRPNGAIIQLGAGGTVSAFVVSPAHLLADVSGYFIE